MAEQSPQPQPQIQPHPQVQEASEQEFRDFLANNPTLPQSGFLPPDRPDALRWIMTQWSPSPDQPQTRRQRIYFFRKGPDLNDPYIHVPHQEALRILQQAAALPLGPNPQNETRRVAQTMMSRLSPDNPQPAPLPPTAPRPTPQQTAPSQARPPTSWRKPGRP